MSLEYLISKYIDGELTSAEDASLRQMLKENPFAKEKFDQSVELHLDIIDDRETITVPTQLLKRTEDAVMMKILANVPVQTKANKAIIWQLNYKVTSFAAAVAFFAIMSLFNVNEGNYPRVIEFIKGIEQSQNLSESSIKNTKTSINKKFTKETELLSNRIEENQNIIIFDESELQASESNNVTNEIASESPKIISTEKFETNKIATDYIVNSLPSIKAKNINASGSLIQSDNNNITDIENVFSINSALNPTIISFGQNTGEIPSVQLTTFVSQDFARTGIATTGNSSMLSMSQSIGYDINGKSSIGIELGMTEFQYDYTKLIPLNKSSAGGNSESGFSVNEPTGNTGGSKIYVPVRLERQEQLIWGMAFYDSYIYNSGDFILSGRIGVGSTNDGPLGLSRLMAKYRVLSSITLTAGAEGRIFILQAPLLNSEVSTISSYGFVYGVQFNF